MKHLTLIRHAKSSWKDQDLSDFERPLNKRGLESAPLMGERLAKRRFQPDMMITSPARRALSTAQIISRKIAFPIEQLMLEPRIYEAGVDTLTHIIRTLDDNWQHVVLVGHNPGFTDLANWMLNVNIDNIPTCGVLEAALDIEFWAQANRKTGRLLNFDYPRHG